MELQKFGHDQSPYERPNEKWVCGWAASGDSCPHGPDPGGHCPVVESCSPVREAGGFHCGRAPISGGPCEQGPRPDGSCCRPAPRWPRCQPRLSLYARRRRTTWLVSIAALALLTILLGGPTRDRLLSPGPMTSAHASVAAAPGQPVVGCAVCHGEEPQSLAGFITAGLRGAPHAALSTSCAACHFDPAVKAIALQAHSVKPEALHHHPGATAQPEVAAASMGASLASSSSRQLSCATCHHEHRGRNETLAVLSDGQCQACHQQRFTSFSRGHPPFHFEQAAADRPRSITFDHAKHQDRFSPADPWSCTRCHDRAKPTAMLPFAQSCGSCHVQSETDHHLQKIESASQLLFQAPEMKVKDTASAGEWSEDIARGDDTPLLTRLLLLGDPDTAKGIADARGWDPLDWGDSDSATVLAIGVKKAMRDLLTGDADALTRRLAAALGLPPADPAVTNLVAVLKAAPLGYTSTQRSALEKFLAFKDAPSLSLPAAKPAQAMSHWAFTDKYTVRYEHPGHADPLAARLLEAAAASAAAPKPAAPGPAEKYRADLVAGILKGQGTLSPLTNNCLRCHGVQGNHMAWSGDAAGTTGNLPVVADPHKRLRTQRVQCTHCHDPASAGSAPALTAAAGAAVAPADHMPVTLERCVSCHGGSKVREDCLTCHVYHLNRPLTANLFVPLPAAAPAPPKP